MSSPTLRSGARRALAAVTAVGLTAGALAATTLPASAADEDLASRFTLAVLPDTQFYARYSSDQFVPRYGTDPFAVQTQWLADHVEELNIPFVAHLGDIVDRAGTQREWEAADRAMKTLDNAPLPYSILPGNHDVTNSGVWDNQLNSVNEPFNRWFGPTRAAKQSTYEGSDATGQSQYHIFEAEGQQFMSLALSWNPSDATLAWAQSVLDAHPTVPVILTNHALINVAADQTSPIETGDSQRMWDELIKSNDQIFMTLNGHFHGATRQVKQNDFGHDVHQILMDYQMAYEGGNGYLGLFEFDLTNNTISLETGSPWVTFKPQSSLTSYDQPLLDGVHQRFTLDVDFAERFAGFDPDFTAGSADEPSLSQAARDILLDGFEGPDPITTELPGDARDFPEVEGTLAHWRFNGHEGVVAENEVFEDIAGDNDLHRVSLAESGSATAELGDVTVETENVHGFSSDGTAVCFDDTDRRTNRLSYLSTEAGAPVTNADLSNGYTIETFVKMSADWSADANQWSKFITRTGNRSTIEGVPWSQWDFTASPTALGISNLREFQFTSIPEQTTRGDKTNWSGEIMVDVWSHVAIVNDPASQTTTMYVDGAPVLRNATSTAGMAFNADMPWILGADWVDNKATQGWHGCIGETRIIDHPTTPDQWLTQRADLTGFTVDQAPEGTLAGDTDEVAFGGTGLPGADVRLSGDLGDQQTVVAEDGSWEIAVTGDVPAGSHDVELVQALGTRSAEPVAVSFGVDLDVNATASVRSLAGKKYVSVVATNNEATAVDIVIATPYGSRTFAGVQPGKSASVSFNSLRTSILAGEATVTVTGTVGGESITTTTTAAYPAS